MSQVIGTIFAQLVPDRPGAQPVHQYVIAPFGLEQCPVRGVVLQNAKAQLASGNNHDTHDQGETKSPPGQEFAGPGQACKGQGQHAPGRHHRPGTPEI
ncbi:hypothetical protein D3C73_1363170 [compost metagenome]